MNIDVNKWIKDDVDKTNKRMNYKVEGWMNEYQSG